ncbi:aldo/keto reductase, partial [Streptomyces sp. JAC18]|uniref:aldo/keto reductase n=1 Tax=Streptomyces sp. JAC18 TaxID=3418414 RepID=UPI003D81B3F1
RGVEEAEYSRWTRDVDAVTQTMSELGVGLVPYPPLGRGFLTGTVDRTGRDSSDFRSSNERIQTDASQAIADTVRQVAE